MAEKTKQQCPIRLYPDDYKAVRAKTQEDGITFQKLAEVLFSLYMNNDKSVMRAVNKYVEEHKSERSKRRYPLDEFEAAAILRKIEEYSPLKEIDDAIMELGNEY